MNYSGSCDSCYAMYDDFDYVCDHWNQEEALLKEFCEIAGADPDECTITKPPDDSRGILIEFGRWLDLEEGDEDEDGGDEDAI